MTFTTCAVRRSAKDPRRNVIDRHRQNRSEFASRLRSNDRCWPSHSIICLPRTRVHFSFLLFFFLFEIAVAKSPRRGVIVSIRFHAVSTAKIFQRVTEPPVRSRFVYSGNMLMRGGRHSPTAEIFQRSLKLLEERPSNDQFSPG